jgi:hypothetical protein
MSFNYCNYPYNYPYCNPCETPYCGFPFQPRCGYPEPIIPACTAYFESTLSVATNIPTGTVGVAATPIPALSTTIPVGTVTPITGYTIGTNDGYIINTVSGQISAPFRANYLITGFIGFSANAVGDRQIYIYKQDGSTGQITLLSESSQNAVATGPTLFSISTKAFLNKGDNIFFAATQNSGVALSTTTDSRVTISKLN